MFVLGAGCVMMRLAAAAGCALLLPTIGHAFDLQSAYSNSSCAVVSVKRAGSSGTGFYINAEGDILTAAHTVFERKVRGSEVNFAVPEQLIIEQIDGYKFEQKVEYLPQGDQQYNIKQDLFIIPTKKMRTCYLALGDSSKLHVGQHLFVIGFPGASPSQVLYDGFLSSRYRLPDFFGDQEFLRLQMPISAGASGGPVLDEQNQVVGVIDAVPFGIAPDLQSLSKLYGSNPDRLSGAKVAGFDLNKAIGELTFAVTELGSPGSGLAIPIELLKR